jgi:hypothetical protein
MRTVYRVLAWVIAGLVIVQAAAIAFGFFGVIHYVEEGNDITPTSMEEATFTGLAGLIAHGIVGTMVIPLAALLLLVASFFSKVRRSTTFALLIIGDIVVQVVLAFSAFGAPVVGILHGANAFVLLVLAVVAARLRTPTAKAASPVAEAQPAAATA